MKPFVGLPSLAEDIVCTYSADLDRPRCTADATVHLAIRSEAWGVVGLLTCPDHESFARATGEVLAEHPIGPPCRLLTGECWS